MTQKVGDSPNKPRRGRPKDPERGRRILEAAREHFDAHGLLRASVDAIAADAGVSKMTVYSHFGTKEGLFEAVVRDRTDRVVGGIAGVEAMDPAFPAQALMSIGEQFILLAREEASLRQFRSLYGAADTQPEACLAFYRQGAERLIADLADYLQQANAVWTLSVAQPRLAADLFLAMFLGDGHIRGLLKLKVPDAAENQALLCEAVRVFLAAYRHTGWTPGMSSADRPRGRDVAARRLSILQPCPKGATKRPGSRRQAQPYPALTATCKTYKHRSRREQTACESAARSGAARHDCGGPQLHGHTHCRFRQLPATGRSPPLSAERATDCAIFEPLFI